jgi:hypothetical protein
VAEFRRIPNLFEIVSFDYWQKNFGYRLPDAIEQHKRNYLASVAGRQHVLSMSEQRLKAAGFDESAWDRMSLDERLQFANAFFGGGHELIVARRHFVDGATHDDQLASSGALTPRKSIINTCASPSTPCATFMSTIAMSAMWRCFKTG